MNFSVLDWKNVVNFCQLVKFDCIDREILESTKGYTVGNVTKESDCYTYFCNGKGNDYLTIKFYEDSISITECQEFLINRTVIDNNLNVVKRTFERRLYGGIYSKIEKQFKQHKDEFKLSSIKEKRYAFTKSFIERIIDYPTFKNTTTMHIFLCLRALENQVDLKEKCSLFNEFSAFLDNYGVKTLVNNRNISSLYPIQGDNVLERIYDLYYGNINPNNESDIQDIHKGILQEEAFAYSDLKKLSNQENLLLGNPLIKPTPEYVDYIKNFMNDNFGYSEEIQLDRDSLLKAIKFKMTKTQELKRKIERKMRVI